MRARHPGNAVGRGSPPCYLREVLMLQRSPSRLGSSLLLCVLTACQAGDPSGAAKGREKQRPEGQASAAATAAGGPGGRALTGTGAAAEGVKWHDWEDGLAEARRTNRPIMLMVYADWCPKCRALAPVLEQPPVATLAGRFVMVRQNHDDEPAWLQPFNQKYGGYVPRIFFFSASGELRPEVTSGHPKYPYFYAASHSELIAQSMRRMLGS